MDGLPSRDGLAQMVFEAKEPLVINDLRNDPRVDPSDRDFLQWRGLTCYVGVPLVVKSEPFGVLFLFYACRARV